MYDAEAKKQQQLLHPEADLEVLFKFLTSGTYRTVMNDTIKKWVNNVEDHGIAFVVKVNLFLDRARYNSFKELQADVVARNVTVEDLKEANPNVAANDTAWKSALDLEKYRFYSRLKPKQTVVLLLYSTIPSR
ncbi:hypothetical protein GEMRC1_000252 [Eukaryota sp. GEM-RC1]